MSLGILGKKIGNSQFFNEKGLAIPVTVIEAGPCYITKILTTESDHYSGVQVGFLKTKERRKTRPEMGTLKKAGLEPLKYLREFRVDPHKLENLKAGEELNVSIMEGAEYVDVTSTSKGKGFAGVMKRHNFKGSPSTHGTHEAFRHGGSIGGRFPQHTIKGRKMPGHMGAKRVTVQNLKLVKVDVEKNLLLVKGSVPGARGNLVIIKPAVKKSKKLRSGGIDN